MDRRAFLLSAAALAACAGDDPRTGRHVKRLAITMDDFAQSFDIGLSLEQRNANILEAFDAVGHKAAGFVTGSFVESQWGDRLVAQWLERGHVIGNHSWTHPHANETDTQQFLSDVELNREHLLRFDGIKDVFRFPYLDDGRDRAQQVDLFKGLDLMGLRNAPVTFDTVDWYTASRLETRLRDNSQTDLAPHRDYYVEMCLTLANYWDAVAQSLGYVSLPHQTLMHHNVLNGYFLKDVLLALKSDGWSFVDASEALAFKPYHDLPPEPTHGRNWLTLKRREAGFEATPYPEAYMNFGRETMDILGL